MNRKAYTTFQISKICNVTHRTVLSWINQGKIKAFKTPGGHSRVREEDLFDFLKQYNIPIPATLKELTVDVLIVDDEPDILSLIEQNILQHAELKNRVVTHKSQNGIDALMYVGKNTPRIVILDICLPHIDGFEICKRIRENKETSDCYIIAISGYNCEESQKKALAAGANEFFPKPFNFNDLCSSVAVIVKKALQ